MDQWQEVFPPVLILLNQKNSFIFPGLEEETLFAAYYALSTLCEEKYLGQYLVSWPRVQYFVQQRVLFQSKPRRLRFHLLITDYF